MTKVAVSRSLTGVSTPEQAFRAEFYVERRWYACRTHARAEKKVDELLGRAGFETYLPLITRERQWADRKKKVAFPLFPGYTFAKFDLSRYHQILSTPGLATVVRANGHPSPVHPEELDCVRLFVTGVERTGVEPEPVDFLESGDPVRVIGGPFAGMSGVLLHRRGSIQVAIRLTSIRRAFSIVLDRALLRLVT
jgi:transcription antitermination factor NusG